MEHTKQRLGTRVEPTKGDLGDIVVERELAEDNGATADDHALANGVDACLLAVRSRKLHHRRAHILRKMMEGRCVEMDVRV